MYLTGLVVKQSQIRFVQVRTVRWQSYRRVSEVTPLAGSNLLSEKSCDRTHIVSIVANAHERKRERSVQYNKNVRDVAVTCRIGGTLDYT